jgi:hypothetical protein
MKRIIFLCLGIALVAAQFGCKGGASKNGNTAANANNVNQVNPVGPNGPNNPNAPTDVAGPGGPLSQDNPKGPKGNMPNVVAPPPSDNNSLSMSSMEFHGALLRGNKEQMAALLADDFKGTMEDGSVVNKTQLLANAKDTGKFYSANVPPPTVKGNSATTAGTITMMSSDPAAGQSGGAPLHFTDTWRKTGDKWLLVATVITK